MSNFLSGAAAGERKVGRLIRKNAIAVKRNKKFKATAIVPHVDCQGTRWGEVQLLSLSVRGVLNHIAQRFDDFAMAMLCFVCNYDARRGNTLNSLINTKAAKPLREGMHGQLDGHSE